MMNTKGLIRGALTLALLVLTSCQKAPTTVITFGGDVMLERNGSPLFTAGNPWGDTSNYLKILEAENPNSIFMVNLESPLTQANKIPKSQPPLPSDYDLCAQSEQVKILQEGFVDLVAIANNHKNDCGANGLKTTKSISESSAIQVAGMDYSPAYLATGDQKIGIIAAEDVTEPLDLKQLVEQIYIARQNCDLLIVSMHWGNEYQAGQNQRQIDLAQTIADAGADILWGHHPHVLQPITWVESKQDGHRMLAMYSLGNLLSDQQMNADTQQTILVSIKIRRGEIIGFTVQPYQMDQEEHKLISPQKEVTVRILERLHVDSLEK